jgi:hypothetical protein
MSHFERLNVLLPTKEKKKREHHVVGPICNRPYFHAELILAVQMGKLKSNKICTWSPEGHVGNDVNRA